MTRAGRGTTQLLAPQGSMIGPVLERLRAEAAAHDSADADTAALIRPLVEGELFRLSPPAPYGAGWATDRSKVMDLYDLLRTIGAANLSAGRLFEGHVNAIKLVFTFGTPEQQAEIGQAVAAGALMGVWNAEPAPGLRLRPMANDFRLEGAKIYASGVGVLDRPLVTARRDDGEVVMIISKSIVGAPFDLSGWRMRGMRATATGTVHLDNVRVTACEILGDGGDYYKSPGFRGGAWRFATVHFGALEEIARLTFQGLRTRKRTQDPHQKVRAAKIQMAVETARLWTRRAAIMVENGDENAAHAESYAGMTRLVVEQSALEVMGLAEQALGLMAFSEAEPIERIVRDLSTYLRQPFPDAVMEGVGEWALAK